MRIQVAWFGLELDFYLGPTTVDDEPEPEPLTTRGDALSTPVGFTRPPTPWDADGPVHQFDPSEEDEEALRKGWLRAMGPFPK